MEPPICRRSPRSRPFRESVVYEIDHVPRRSSPHIGAEIGNIDLTKPLTNKQVRSCTMPSRSYQVIFFRDQKISFEDQIRLAGYFGPLGTHVGTVDDQQARPTTRSCANFITTRPPSRSRARTSTPISPARAIPPLGSILYNHTIPPDGGGDTMFASMYAAYDALSPDMKNYLEGADRDA